MEVTIEKDGRTFKKTGIVYFDYNKNDYTDTKVLRIFKDKPEIEEANYEIVRNGVVVKAKE